MGEEVLRWPDRVGTKRFIGRRQTAEQTDRQAGVLMGK